MASRVIEKPDWNTLPVPLASPWYDSPKIRQVASGGFALLGAGFGVSFYFTASPSRFLLLALAAASFVVARRVLAIPQDKNAIAVALRQKAGGEIEKSGTFKDFQIKYRDLISKKILQPTDVNFVVERDVQVLDYAAFLAKHADARCKKALIDALQLTSRELLQAKCLAMFVANPSQAPDEADNALLDRKTPKVNEQALVAKDWNEFVRNGGQSADVTDPAAVEALKRLFLSKAYRREVGPRGVGNFFPEEERKSIEKTMTIFELELVADGQLPFSELKWCKIGEEEIVDYFSQMNPDKQGPLKQKLKEHYLTTFSSDQLKSEVFKRRREAGGITLEMIENAQGSVRSDCKLLPYLGAKGFREKYGNKHLNDGSLTPELLDKIKIEFRAALPTAVSISEEIYDDALILQLGEEIVVPRWMKMPLKDLWNKEIGIFYDYCRKNPGAIPAFKQKMIEDLKDLSIFQILRDFNGILSTCSLFLQPADQSASGKTFAELAEQAVQTAGKLNAVMYHAGHTVHYLVDCISSLLKCGLLSPTSPALRGAIKASLDEDGPKIFENLTYAPYYNPERFWGKLGEVWSTVNAEVEAFYESACLEVRQAQQTLEAEKAKIDREEFKSKAQTERNEKKQASARHLEALKKEKDEFRGSRRRWDVGIAVGEARVAIESLQKELIALQSALRGLPDVQRRLEAQIAVLAAQSAPDGGLLIEATQSLQNLRSNLPTQLPAAKEKLAQKEKEHRLLTEQFEMFANRGEILKKLRANLAALPAEIEKCRADSGIAEKALGKAKEDHAKAKAQENSLNQQELAKADEIQQLEAEQTKLSGEIQSNAEKTAFNAGKEDRKDKLDAAYQTFVKERLVTFEKMLLPV